ncbi:SdiA-regulated domain-containing protein, partial [Salmonella enterica]
GSDDVDGDVGGFGGECLNSRTHPLASDGRNSLWIVSEPDRFYRFSRTTTS